MESLWRKQTKNLTSDQNQRTVSSENRHRDVIVIGAALAGILIAYYLKREGKFEADGTLLDNPAKKSAKIQDR